MLYFASSTLPPSHLMYTFRLWNSSFPPFKCLSYCPGRWKSIASRWNHGLDAYNICTHYMRARGRKSHCFIHTRPDHGALSQWLKVCTSCMLDRGQSAFTNIVQVHRPPGWCTWQLELIYPSTVPIISRSPSTRRITFYTTDGTLRSMVFRMVYTTVIYHNFSNYATRQTNTGI